MATCLPSARKSLSITSNWIATVDAIYRELLFREIWRDYDAAPQQRGPPAKLAPSVPQ